MQPMNNFRKASQGIFEEQPEISKYEEVTLLGRVFCSCNLSGKNIRKKGIARQSQLEPTPCKNMSLHSGLNLASLKTSTEQEKKDN